MNNNKLDELLADALTPDVRPYETLNEQILRKAKEEAQMKGNTWNGRRTAVAAAIAAAVLVTGAGTTYAAWRYLSPQEVAGEINDTTLADAFRGADARIVNESQTGGAYRATLIGIVSGKAISDFEARSGDEVLDDRSYWLLAIEHVDGTPMPDTSSPEYGGERFLASPFVEGLNPGMYNVYSFSGGYTEFVKDGVLYRMGECDNLEVFADREVYLGLTDDDSLRSVDQGYVFDEKTGKITRNESYEGCNILFRLPLDPAKADAAKADAYVASLFDSPEEEAEKDREIFENLPESQKKEIEEGEKLMKQANAFVEKLTADNIDELCEKVAGTENEIKADPNSDWIEYGTANSQANGGMQMKAFQEIFGDETPKIYVDSYGLSDAGGEQKVHLIIIRRYEDGRLTVAEYKAKNLS